MVREDLDMSKGKMIAQGAHASLKAYRKASQEDRESWGGDGEKKIVLAVSQEQMVRRFQQAKDQDLPAAMVQDAGMTEIEPGTKTAAAVGPAQDSKIDSVTGDLKLIK